VKSQFIALFGEAEKGSYSHLKRITSLEQLCEEFGHPPEDSLGISFAVQALLFQKELIYIRVQQEGFSHEDYIRGIHLLEKACSQIHLSAICLPGVGDNYIIEPTFKLCEQSGSLLLTTSSDLYDYLTDWIS